MIEEQELAKCIDKDYLEYKESADTVCGLSNFINKKKRCMGDNILRILKFSYRFLMRQFASLTRFLILIYQE